VKGVSTAFWSIVLLGSTVSIAAGFAGGRSIGSAGSLKPRELDTLLPPPIAQRVVHRSLAGLHSLDAALAYDPYGDPERGVAAHPAERPGYDPRTDRARVAVIVIDAGRAGGELSTFVSSPLPLTLAVAPQDDGARATCAAIAQAGKTVVVDASEARPTAVAALLRDGARGVIASLDAAQATALMRAVGPGAIVVDASLAEDDDVYRVARRTAHRALTRDVIADARDDGPYVDFMLRDALAIAQRNGAAIVAIHARTGSYDALTRFADRAQRDGVDLVPLDDLVPAPPS
jgi:polysaccharide deacetylase 2 family uncharacterized protein YibQ